ncbi:helix-turn-helix domain-containing protein [Mesorhizobium sp. M1E.F.Ca.ET.041.01.1.1]|uniref:helix-turn-helix domain-containing protein n=1 Tax=Mesorhizobium sp. M1E.F.Ca.ET.041.01.1.1 TaxID=2496759 RepID=UPI001676287F|nr:helix-turn-helix domain-containing protein [Mesorhizobium sp. M1E.F.Ca.ET.041.01.1.1]
MRERKSSERQSLERELKLLKAVDQAKKPIGTRELARLLDLSSAIAQRLVNTLTERHYLQRDPDTKRYMIGYQTLTFGEFLVSTAFWSMTVRNVSSDSDPTMRLLQATRAERVLKHQRWLQEMR